MMMQSEGRAARNRRVRSELLRRLWIPTALFVGLIVFSQFGWPGGLVIPWFVVAVIVSVTTPLVWWAIAGRGRWPRLTGILAGAINRLLSDFRERRVRELIEAA